MYILIDDKNHKTGHLYYNSYSSHHLLPAVKSEVFTIGMHKDLQNRDAFEESRDHHSFMDTNPFLEYTMHLNTGGYNTGR